MAQERRSLGIRARMLARRYGLTGGRLAAMSCTVLLVVGVAAGLVWHGLGGGASLGGEAFSIDRTQEAEARESEEGAGSADAVASGDAPSETSDGEEKPAGSQADVEPQVVVVHVDGAVATPGVYDLPAGARANDAVDAAGGLASDADTSSINLATPLADGDKVHVPRVGEAGSGSSAPVSGDEAPDASGGTSSGSSPNGLVNINTATASELQALPGVGEATAQAIVQDREKNGAFGSKEDLMRVSGIGEKKFAKLEASICV